MYKYQIKNSVHSIWVAFFWSGEQITLDALCSLEFYITRKHILEFKGNTEHTGGVEGKMNIHIC